MQQNLLFCEKCNIYHFPNFEEDTPKTCSHCDTELIITDISYEDYKEMPKSKRCKQCKRKYPKIFIKCPKCNKQLIKLSTENAAASKQLPTIINSPNSNQQTQPKCPYCNSTDIKKITTVNRAISVSAFGLASSKVGKQWHCNNCKSDF